MLSLSSARSSLSIIPAPSVLDCGSIYGLIFQRCNRSIKFEMHNGLNLGTTVDCLLDILDIVDNILHGLRIQSNLNFGQVVSSNSYICSGIVSCLFDHPDCKQ